MWWDDQSVYGFYKKSKLDSLKKPVQVYISVGELEGKSLIESWGHLKDFFEQKKHPNIQLKTEMLKGEMHLTGIGLAHSRAFRRLYEIK